MANFQNVLQSYYRGDTLEARKFKGYAMTRVRLMKLQMGLLGIPVMQQRFKVSGREVYIVVNVNNLIGIDRIEISARLVIEPVECFNFAGIPLTLPAPTGGPTGIITFTPIDLDFLTYFHTWDFGDSSYSWRDTLGSPQQSAEHGYIEAGEYTVKASFSTSANEDITSSVVTNLVKERRIPSGGQFKTTEAEAWTIYQAASWAAVGSPGTQPTAAHFLWLINSGGYRYDSFRSTFDIDLTAYDDSLPIYMLISFVQPMGGNQIDFTEPTTWPILDGGVKTSLGGNIDRLGKSPRFAFTSNENTNIPYFLLSDITSFAETIITGVTLTDNTDYARKTSWLFGKNGSELDGPGVSVVGCKIIRIANIECSKTKTDYIEMT